MSLDHLELNTQGKSLDEIKESIHGNFFQVSIEDCRDNRSAYTGLFNSLLVGPFVFFDSNDNISPDLTFSRF